MTDSLPTRPDPDALLAEVRRQDERRRRGKLKVFFGMSAGVGKTYAMLEEARKRAAEGLDVLVGYAEPHIRPDTEAVLVALDILPYKLVEYRGATLKEFDLDAALARRPAVCCVDELAHTNAPGLRHPKRWQDIDELLTAGIDVYTTLNVQHLESMNDLVERITGVRVRETLPDAVFDAADEVELVDIAPDELLERFREGRIYRPEQAERAARHFFTKGNLIALRELALRKTAERVDEQVQQYRRDERLRHIVPASEKVLVCVGPSPLSGRLVRSARRLAWGLRAKLVAVSVEPEAGVTPGSLTEGLAANLKLAEELGADVVTLTGRRVATEVLAYALTHNVTKIVVGKPDRPRWREVLFGSVVDDLIRGSGEIDVYVIRGASEAATRPSTAVARPAAHDWPGYAAAVAVVALVTLISWPLFHRFGVENENVLMLYLLGVLLVATRRSRGAALLTGTLSVAAFDFVFAPPFYTFSISDRQYAVTFVVMLLTALVISVQTHRIRAQAQAARDRERRTAALLSLSRDLAVSQSTAQIATATERHTRDALGVAAVVLVPDRTAAAPGLIAIGDGVPVGDKEMGVAQWAFEHDRPAGRGTDTLPAAAGTYVPLRGPRGMVGVLGVFAGDQPAGPQRSTVEAFAAQAALAIERAELAEEARKAWERVETESLRNTLLSGVSHDLRTPLAGITGIATTLIDTGDALPPAERSDLLGTLLDEAGRLERLLTNLLDMTRMESGGLALKREWTPLGDVIGTSLHALDRRLEGRAVGVAIVPDLPLVCVDETALGQVFVNLLENAVEHTPAGSPIDITAAPAAAGRVRIQVSDRGPGLPAGSETRVFEKFFRVPAKGRGGRGVGLGLAICRGIVEAHGGTIAATNRAGGGAEFFVNLPVGGIPPTVDTSA